MIDDDFDAQLDAESERAQARYERRQFFQHMAHPDCRDPDHRGCSLCNDNTEDDHED